MRKQIWEIGNRYMLPKNELQKSMIDVHSHVDLIKQLENLEELEEAIITLQDNIPSTLVIKPNTIVNVTLNNHSIKGNIFTESNGEMIKGNTDSYAFWAKEGCDLTIKGNGIVESQDAKYSMAVWAQGGTVYIYGGKYYNHGEGSDLIYASEGGKVYIHGGEFHACPKQESVDGTNNQYSALNVKDRDRDISEIVVYGGKFYGFNPADNLSEGPGTNFVAEGYKSVEIEENVWEVVKA